jgi:hypothetical protein
MKPIKITTNIPPTVACNGKEMSANLKQSLAMELEQDKRIVKHYGHFFNQRNYNKMEKEEESNTRHVEHMDALRVISNDTEPKKEIILLSGIEGSNQLNELIEGAATLTPMQELEQSIRSAKWHTFRNSAGKIKAYNDLRNQNRVCVEVVGKDKGKVMFCHVWFNQFGKKMGDTFVVQMNPELLVLDKIYNIPQADYDKLLSNKI